MVGRRVPGAARLRATDVLPEPAARGPARGSERAAGRAGHPPGRAAPEGAPDRRGAQGAQPDEGRLRGGGVARAAHAGDRVDRLREDAPPAGVLERPDDA